MKPVLSLPRLAALTTTLAVLGAIAAVSGVLVLRSGLDSHASKRAQPTDTRALATRVEAVIRQYQQLAIRLAKRTTEAGLLQEKKTADRQQLVEILAVTIPEIRRLRFIPVSPAKLIDGPAPDLEPACLDLVERVARGERIPDATLHSPGTATAHIDVIVPVLDGTDSQRVLAHVLLSLNTSALDAAVKNDGEPGVFTELEQVSATGTPVPIAGSGNSHLRGREPVGTSDLNGGHWRLTMWTDTRTQSLAAPDLLLAIALLLLALGLLLLAVTLPRRWLGATLHQDAATFASLFNDVRSGVVKSQYPFRLREFATLAKQIRAASEEMLPDLRELEPAPDESTMAGLASRTTFEQRLTQLQRQARLGFNSVLLIGRVDDFDEISAQIGSEASQALLEQSGQQLRKQLRPGDLVAQLENNCIAILFPFVDIKRVAAVTERLRAQITAERVPGIDPPRTLTWSAGLTPLHATDRRPDDVVLRAQRAMASAREAGGNRVVTQMPPA